MRATAASRSLPLLTLCEGAASHHLAACYNALVQLPRNRASAPFIAESTMTSLHAPVVADPRSICMSSVKFDGSLNYTWPAYVLWHDADGFIWHTPAGAPFTRPQGIYPVPFDWIGRIWYDRWYMVDCSLVPPSVAGVAGAVHHYYCNIGAPGAWDGDGTRDRYRFVDLDLDVMIYPDGRHALLDEDEFAAHQVRFDYPAETVAAVRQAAEDVVMLARSGLAPFDGTLSAYHAALHDATNSRFGVDERP